MIADDGVPHDFSLVTTDQIIAELFKRHDGVVVVTLQDRGEDERVVVDFHGGLTMAIGLARRAARLFEKEGADNEVDEKGDE